MTRDNARHQEHLKQFGRVVAAAWADPSFKTRLLGNPTAALAEYGIHVPHGQEVRVVEETPAVAYVVLPPKPAADIELSDELLASAVGGAPMCHWTHGYCGGCYAVDPIDPRKFNP